MADKLAELKEALGKQGLLDEDGQSGGGAETEDGSGGANPNLEDSLDKALEAMRGSEDALGNEALEQAIRDIQAAIAALREAGETLAEASAGQDGDDASGRDQAAGEGDPFGRDGENNGGENDHGFETDLGEQNKQKRARELLEELRRRSSEEGRDQIEKDYFERLLKQF